MKVTVTVKPKDDSPEDRGWKKVVDHGIAKAHQESWITKDGRQVKFCDMEDDHLFNILNYLHKLGMSKSFALLEAEAMRRGYTLVIFTDSIQWVKL